MTTKHFNKSPSNVSRRTLGSKAASSRDQEPAKAVGRKREAPPEHRSQVRVTKHAQLLQLLSRPEGASVEDMMRATEWQQHSVRGFLAGTVKKMGLAITSSKAEGEVRRYRIATRRGR